MKLSGKQLRQLIRLVLSESLQRQKINPQKSQSLPFKEPDTPDHKLVDLLSNIGKTQIKSDLSGSDKELISQRINQDINLAATEYLSKDPSPKENLQNLEYIRKKMSEKYVGDFESNIIDKKIKFLIDRHNAIMGAPSSHNDAIVRMILYDNQYKQEIRKIKKEYEQKEFETNEKLVDITGEANILEKDITQLKQRNIDDSSSNLQMMQRLKTLNNKLSQLSVKKMSDRKEMYDLIKIQKQKMASMYEPK